MGLRKTGLELVMKGHTQFMTHLAVTNKGIDTLQNRLKNLSKSPLRLSGKSLKDLIPQGILDRLKGFSTSFKGVGELVGQMSPRLAALTGGFSGLSSGILGSVSSLNLYTAAAIAATVAIISLGMRGAAMPGMIEAFDVAARSSGTLSETLLNDLRQASAGTVRDIDLVRVSNVALAGASGQLRAALGKGGLAGLMQIARTQARATGESVDFLFQSLVTGIKRGSPLLIDDTGLVLKEGEANETYAKALGKTVEQLTAEEKQIALLNATLAAGKEAVNSYGKGAIQASERIAQINATMSNMLDRLALSVQPIFNVILELGKTILDVLVYPLNTVVIPVFHELVNTIFGPLLQAFMAVKAGVNDLLAPVFELIHHWMVVWIGVIRGVGWAFSWLVKSIGNLLGPVKDMVKKYLVEPFTKFLDPVQFAKRGGYVIGALAEGFLWAGNNLVLPAVIAIATLIADFLMGFSPPKKGPLSRIDEGGANIMRAWLQGFTGTSLTPVSEMAAAVAGELGGIGRLTYEQADQQLKFLDQQLQPYLDLLELAKARVSAIAEPLQQLQEATNARLQRELEQFTQGQASAEAVRALDSQNGQLADRLDLLHSLTDEAEYQLALKQSEQAVERAMLQVQMKRTKPVEALTEAEKLALDKGTEASKSGGGASDSAAPDAGSGLSPLGADAVGGFLGVSDDEIKALWGELKNGFGEGLLEGMGSGAKAELAKFQANAAKLKTQTDRMKGSKPFQNIQAGVDAVFGTGPNSLSTVVQVCIDRVQLAWNAIFGTGPNTLSAVWDAFKVNLDGKFTTFKADLSALWASGTGWVSQLFGGFSLDNLKTTFSDFFGEGGTASQILDGFTGLLTNLFKTEAGGILYDLLAKVGDVLVTLIGAPVEGMINSILSGMVDLLNGVVDSLNSMIEGYNSLPIAPDIGKIDRIGSAPQISIVPKAKQGGFFGPGLVNVHAGETMVAASSRYAVFPKTWVQVMERLSHVMAPSRSAGSSVSTVDNSRRSNTVINATFTGGASRRNFRMQLAELRGWSG